MRICSLLWCVHRLFLFFCSQLVSPSLCLHCGACLVMSSNLIIAYHRPWSDWAWLWAQSLLLPAFLLLQHLLSCNRIWRRGKREGAAPGEKQKTWLGTQSVLLCNNWPTNIHLETQRGAERERERESLNMAWGAHWKQAALCSHSCMYLH